MVVVVVVVADEEVVSGMVMRGDVWGWVVICLWVVGGRVEPGGRVDVVSWSGVEVADWVEAAAVLRAA